MRAHEDSKIMAIQKAQSQEHSRFNEFNSISNEEGNSPLMKKKIEVDF